MYEIVNVQYTGTYNNGGTSIPAVLGEFRASSAADLPAQNVDCHIICGCDGLDIATGDRYIWDGAAWILQPSQNAFSNVYTTDEIDTMITTLYQYMMYYHTRLVSIDGTITFYTFGETVENLIIYGNGSQTGTPTPDNPAMPTFCGVRTRNLAPPTWASDFLSRVTLQPGFVPRIQDDYLLVYARNGFGNYDTEYLFTTEWKQNTQYTFCLTYLRESNQNTDPMLAVVYTDETDENFPDTVNDGEWHTIYVTTTANKTIKYLRIRYLSGSLKIKIDNFYVYEGIEQKPYEPFGYKIPITCAGQITPVYLGEVPTVRRVKKMVLTGAENFYNKNDTNPERYLYYFTSEASHYPKAIQDENSVCTHLRFGAYTNKSFYISENGSIFYINFGQDIMNAQPSGNTAAGLKEYLSAQYAAGTPVTVWYVLATPQTGIVNEPLAKIGDYADELHITDADVSIPTVSGENTLTVDTTLPPSKIVISGE